MPYARARQERYIKTKKGKEAIRRSRKKEVAKLMGYRTTEKNRTPGYKQIKNIKKSIINKFR